MSAYKINHLPRRVKAKTDVLRITHETTVTAILLITDIYTGEASGGGLARFVP